MSTLTINKHYNFSVYANAVLGTSYRNTKLISILDYDTALKFANIDLLHRQVFPYLPPGSLSDYIKYTYYLFVYNSKTIVIADQWMIQESIEETLGLNYTLKLNNITSNQLTIVRDQLKLLSIPFEIV